MTDIATQAEPTSTPIACAERLRSPSVSAQNEEELGDASEVDLLLSEATNMALSELAARTVQLGRDEESSTSEAAQPGDLLQKSGTLSDKLEVMELDSSAEGSKQATPVRDDVPMADAKADHIPIGPSDKTITPVSSSSTHNPSPPSAFSQSTPKISEKQARFNRGVSPEANHVTMPNLFGFYNHGQKKQASKPSPTKDTSSSPNLKAAVTEPTSTKVKFPEVIPESSSSDDDDRPATQSPLSPRQPSEVPSPNDLYPPPSASVHEESSDSADKREPSSDERSDSASSSPKSYGREIVPSPPPRRKILVQTPTSKAANAAEVQESSNGPSPQPSSVAPVSASTDPDPLKEPSRITRELILGIDSETEEPKASKGNLKKYMSSYASSVIRESVFIFQDI